MTYTEAPTPTAELNTAQRRNVAADRELVQAIAEGSPRQNEIYVRYRRPLLQIFLQRRIDRDAAEDLLQRTFLRAVVKIRTEGLDDPGKLGGFLYRTAVGLAKMYWRGDKTRQQDTDSNVIANLPDGALSIEERIDKEQLAACVRELMGTLAGVRDRAVLERYYLDDEPRESIRVSLQLTDLQFNQVLWRARQRFGDILHRSGLYPRPARSTGE